MNELKNRAAEMEHAERLPEAVELFIRLARETEGVDSAAWWRRAGALQNRLQKPAESARSLEQAVDGFAAAGLRNAAVATGLDLLATGSNSPAAVTRLLRLAVEKEYRRFARAAASALARSGEASTDPTVGDELVRYLERWPEDAETAVEELAEAAASGDTADAQAFLKTLWTCLPESSVPKVEEALRRSIARIDPAEAARIVGAETEADGDYPEDELPGDELPLIIDDRPGASADPRSVPRLDGLIPTHAAVDDQPEVVDPERLVVEHDSFGADYFAGGERSRSGTQPEGVEDDSDALPLLESGEASKRRVRLDDVDQGDGPRPPGSGSDDTRSADTGERPRLDPEEVLRDLAPLAPGAVDPSDPAEHYEFAVALRQMGMTGDALARLRAALEGGYDPLVILEAVGGILVGEEGHDVHAAVRILGHARNSPTATDARAAGALYWLARGEETLGNSREAVALLERVVRVAPGYLDAAERLRRLVGDDFDTLKQLN